jgi:hypothetical protein
MWTFHGLKQALRPWSIAKTLYSKVRPNVNEPNDDGFGPSGHEPDDNVVAVRSPSPPSPSPLTPLTGILMLLVGFPSIFGSSPTRPKAAATR